MSVAIGAGIAAIIVVHGVSTSSAGVEATAPGTASAQLTALQKVPVDRTPPSDVQAGLAGGSARTDAVRALGTVGGDRTLYAAVRPSGGVCNALAGAKGGVGTTCADTLRNGITISASDDSGWVVYGFAADDVVAVDVIVDGVAQPASMLPDAYALELGTADLGDASALVVHHADGSAETVKSGLQAPPGA
ncbi:MAG TPA: hypothetical protein VGK92_11325 [Gaiellales bacterium]